MSGILLRIARWLADLAWWLEDRPVPQLNSPEDYARRIVLMTGQPYSRGLPALIAARELPEIIERFKP